MNDAIRALLHPQSIAIIGASSDFNKINGRTFKALVDKGYAGRIFPVNPKFLRLRIVAQILAVPINSSIRILRDLPVPGDCTLRN